MPACCPRISTTYTRGMAERLVKLYLEGENDAEITRKLPGDHIFGVWSDRLGDGTLEVTILPRPGHNDDVLHWLEDHLGSRNGYRVALLPIVASLPREVDEEEQQEEKSPERISQEELYQDVSGNAQLSRVYLVLLLLSAVVAAAGMLRNDPAVIIGAMVIAPLLGPNVALSLATTLGDAKLARQAISVLVVGVAVTLLLSIPVGMLFNNLLGSPEVAARTQVDLANIAIALAAGSAAVLSYTTGAPAAMIGVMVAVALLPPLVSFGMLLGGGLWAPALGALLLFAVNIICVNLAGVATFLAQGITPNRWFEAQAAQRATRTAIAIWITLLAVLIGIIVLADPATHLRLDLQTQ